MLEERDGSGALLVRYVYGHDLISQTRNGVVSYYHYDGLGSTRALTNEAEAVTDTYTYDAFGGLLEKMGTTTNHYLFAGEQFDKELGFYYLRARYMNPAIGRFVTMDTFAGIIKEPYSLHKYLYANANPVNTIDPSGYEGTLLSQITATQMWQNVTKISITCFGKRLMKNTILGGLFGALASGFDAWLGGESVINAMVHGAKSGAMAGLLTTIPYIRPIVVALGFTSSLEGIYDSTREGNYAQAAFRTLFLYWQVKKLIDKRIWSSDACFTGETLIYTKDGYKQIKDIAIGDEVYSKNVETGENGFKRVKQVIVKKTNVLIYLFIILIQVKFQPLSQPLLNKVFVNSPSV